MKVSEFISKAEELLSSVTGVMKPREMHDAVTNALRDFVDEVGYGVNSKEVFYRSMLDRNVTLFWIELNKEIYNKALPTYTVNGGTILTVKDGFEDKEISELMDAIEREQLSKSLPYMIEEKEEAETKLAEITEKIEKATAFINRQN